MCLPLMTPINLLIPIHPQVTATNVRDQIMINKVWRLAQTLGSWFRILLEAWKSAFILCVVLCIIILSGVRASPLGTAATIGLLYQPQMIHDDDCGAIGGMKFDRVNRSTRRKPASAPLCLPQIPHDLTRARTRAAGVGSQRLTAWAMVLPFVLCR
jgi:hypothetical protein